MSALIGQIRTLFIGLLHRIKNNEEIIGTRNDMTQREILEEKIAEIVRLCVETGEEEADSLRCIRRHVYVCMSKAGRGNELVLETQQ